MIKGFTFEHEERTFTCTIEKRTIPPVGWWWWFAVTGDSQRYAPFEADEKDTERGVRRRIAAYYDNVLEVRARPPEPRHQFSRPGRPPNKPKVPQD